MANTKILDEKLRAKIQEKAHLLQWAIAYGEMQRMDEQQRRAALQANYERLGPKFFQYISEAKKSLQKIIQRRVKKLLTISG